MRVSEAESDEVGVRGEGGGTHVSRPSLAWLVSSWWKAWKADVPMTEYSTTCQPHGSQVA